MEARGFYSINLVYPLLSTRPVLFKALPGGRTHQNNPPPPPAACCGWCQGSLPVPCPSPTLLIHGTLRGTGFQEGLKTWPADLSRTTREGFPGGATCTMGLAGEGGHPSAHPAQPCKGHLFMLQQELLYVRHSHKSVGKSNKDDIVERKIYGFQFKKRHSLARKRVCIK